MTNKFDRYRKGKEEYGGRLDKTSPIPGYVLIGLLVLINASAWFFGIPGYQKMLEQPAQPETTSSSFNPAQADETNNRPLHPGLLLTDKKPDEMALVFFDIGQGDAIFFQTPTGENVLIDSGEGSNPDFKFARAVAAAKKLILPFFRRNKIKHLDYFITSHPHSDHIGSSYEIVDNVSIDEVWAAGYEHPSTSKKDLLNAIEQKKQGSSDVKFKIPSKAGGTLEEGQALDLGPAVKGWLLRTAPHKAENPNQASLSLLVYYGETGILLTGDTERHGEKEMIKNWSDQLDVEILKSGHHGSRTSNIKPFINMVKPEHSVIMVGHYNTFGHPNEVVLSRLKRAGSKIHRTDKDGTIFMFLDGKSIDVRKKPAVSAVND